MAKKTGEMPKDGSPKGGTPNGETPKKQESREKSAPRHKRDEDYVRRLEERERFYRDSYYRNRYYGWRNWNRPYWNRRPYGHRYDWHQQQQNWDPSSAPDSRHRQDRRSRGWFQPRPVWERERRLFFLVIWLIGLVTIVRFLASYF